MTAKETPRWSGTGLPPVGTICEYYYLPCGTLGEDIDTYVFKDRAWVTVKVIMHYIDKGSTFAILHAPGLGFRGCSDVSGQLFRPKSKIGVKWLDNEHFEEIVCTPVAKINFLVQHILDTDEGLSENSRKILEELIK